MALSREEIAARYSAALFGYAQDMKTLDAVYTELNVLKDAVNDNPSFIKILSNPILNKDEKKKTLKVIAKQFSLEVQNFLNLLLEYGRFANLTAIISHFNFLYDQAKAIASGTATTAVKLNDEQLDRLGKSYAEKYGLKSVRLENQVDPSILGGVILKVNDRVIDGSVKTKLKMIRAQLNEN